MLMLQRIGGTYKASVRVLTQYVAETDIPVLRSTAASLTDRWSMFQYNWKIELEGGEEQYFTHDLDNWRPL